MTKDSKKRKSENNSRTPQVNTSVEGSRLGKRKRGEDETPRKKARVCEMARPSTSCQHQNTRVLRSAKRKMTQEEDGPSPPAKRMKTGLPEEVPTKEDTSTGSRKRNQKRKAEDSEEPTTRKTKTEEGQVDSQRAEFQEKYVDLHLLGSGGFGSVFAGYRAKGRLPVAIKHIPKKNVPFSHTEEDGRKLNMEVALMLKLRTVPETHPAVLNLLDWYDLGQELVLVMERPMFAEDLVDYINMLGGYIYETEAKIILKQLVDVAVYLQKANIFHRDIKVDNILIETDSDDLQIYLIDFGLGCFDDGKEHRDFCGTFLLTPPEWLVNETYRAEHTTVWQVGVVLFELLHFTRFHTRSFVINNLIISPELSDDCQDFLRNCLTFDPNKRPTLENLLSHPWFS